MGTGSDGVEPLAGGAGRRGPAPLVLSLFPGIGLLDRWFEAAGWAVVRGPDLIWGGDVRRFRPPAGRFDGIIGGPPCQVWSVGRNLAVAGGSRREREDLIGEFERVVGEAEPLWWCMECAPRSRAAEVPGYRMGSVLLHNRDFGAVQMRCRRWTWGVRGTGPPLNLWRYVEIEALHRPEKAAAVMASGALYEDRHRTVVLADGRVSQYRMHSRARKETVRRALELQGLPEDFFGDETPLTVEGQQRLVGNGVPRWMGMAVAAAVGRMCREFGLPAPEEEERHGNDVA